MNIVCLSMSLAFTVIGLIVTISRVHEILTCAKCPLSWDFINNECVYVGSEYKDWTTARDECLSLNARMPQDGKEAELIAKTSGYGKTLWTGWCRLNTGWIHFNGTMVDDVPFSLQNDRLGCVTVKAYPGKVLYAIKKIGLPMCLSTPLGIPAMLTTCEEEAMIIDGNCYMLMNDSVSFNKAQRQCEDKGYSLADPRILAQNGLTVRGETWINNATCRNQVGLTTTKKKGDSCQAFCSLS